MRIRMILVIFSMIFLFQGTVDSAGVYLGTLNIMQNDQFDFSLPIRADRDLNQLALKVEKKFFMAEKDKISAHNLFILTRSGAFPLSESFIQLNKRNLLDSNKIHFKLRLQSAYSPGLYRNNLIIQTERGEERLKIDFEIPTIMEVRAGGDMNPNIKYSEGNFSQQIYSSGQSKLLIRANKAWTLKVNNEGGEDLEIKLKEFKGNGSVSNSRDEFIKIGKEAVIIAQGNKTTELPGGDAELIYVLRIDDFREIKAGQKDYQLNFIIE